MGGKARAKPGRLMMAMRCTRRSPVVEIWSHWAAPRERDWFADVPAIEFEALGGPTLTPGVPMRVRVVIEEVEE